MDTLPSVVCELSTHVIKIINKTVAVLKRSTSNRFDWLFYSREFLFFDKQPEKHSTKHCTHNGDYTALKSRVQSFRRNGKNGLAIRGLRVQWCPSVQNVIFMIKTNINTFDQWR